MPNFATKKRWFNGLYFPRVLKRNSPFQTLRTPRNNGWILLNTIKFEFSIYFHFFVKSSHGWFLFQFISFVKYYFMCSEKDCWGNFSSRFPFIEWKVWFTTVPFRAFFGQLYWIGCPFFSFWKLITFKCWFSKNSLAEPTELNTFWKGKTTISSKYYWSGKDFQISWGNHSTQKFKTYFTWNIDYIHKIHITDFAWLNADYIYMILNVNKVK